MDKVSVYVIRENRVEEVISAMVGKDAFLTNINKLNEIEFDSDVSISSAIMQSNVGMGDGYSILISDFLTDENYESAIDRFAEKKRDIFCVQILSREELTPQFRGKMHLFDSENPMSFFRKKIDRERVNAYKAALKYITDKIKNYCEARGGHYMLVPADTALADVFFGGLVDMGVLK